MQNRFLLEIYTEEIPYLLQRKASEDIKILWESALKQNNLEYSTINVYSTAKRLTVLIDGLPNKTLDTEEEKRGPDVNANQEIVEAFCKSKNINKTNLIKKDIKGKTYYFAKITTKGQSIKHFLTEVLLPSVLLNVKFSKSMIWNNSKQLWARPIRNLLAVLENDNGIQFLDFEFANVKSSTYTFGHKILSPQELRIVSIDDYFYKLEHNFVILDFSKRKDIILQKVSEIEEKYTVTAYIPNTLLDEIAYLIEYPYVLLGSIEKQYLSLPKELLVDIAVSNQRYITLFNKEDNLFNKFIIVANNVPKDEGQAVISGNEQVLSARLQDGLFFYNQDLKEDFLLLKEKLKDLNYFTKLGTLYDKTERVKQLFYLIFKEKQDLLCDLYKNDLVSATVYEIPALQGIMGKYYSLEWGNNNKILNINELSNAIGEHYKPQGPSDSLPKTKLGAKLALLDKLDNLIQFFSIGEQPTGSKDPYGLRRSALGIIRIIIDNKFDIDLQDHLTKDLSKFILDRFIFYIKLNNLISNQETYKALSNIRGINICRLYSKLISIDNLLNSDEGLKIWETYQRVTNLLQTKQDALKELKVLKKNIDSNLLDSDDNILYSELNSIKQKGSAINISDILNLSSITNNYLNNVLVSHSNIDVQNNRLLMLYNLSLSLGNFIYKTNGDI